MSGNGIDAHHELTAELASRLAVIAVASDLEFWARSVSVDGRVGINDLTRVLDVIRDTSDSPQPAGSSSPGHAGPGIGHGADHAPPTRPGIPLPGGHREAHPGQKFPLTGMALVHDTGNPWPMVLRCLLVDDNPLFLESARALLERGGISVVGMANTSAEALRRTEELKPDFALLDVDLGGESGFDLAGQLERETSLVPSRMIMTSAYAAEDFADLITATRAAGFISKSNLSVRAVREVLGMHSDAEDLEPPKPPRGR